MKKSAADLNEQGEKLLFTRRSSTSVLNAVPVQRAQTQRELEKSADLFERALAEDASFGLAAYNLGQAYHLLLKYDQSLKSFRLASQIDSEYLDARIQTAAVLIERGDPDEAIREQLTDVLRLEPANDYARAMLARAFWDKGAWSYSIEQADLAIVINDQNAQAHLWKADSTRQMAAAEEDGARRQQLYSAACKTTANSCASRTSRAGRDPRLAFHFVGFGLGSRTHADREGAYDSLRSAGFLGLCLSEQKVGNPLRAREYCGLSA